MFLTLRVRPSTSSGPTGVYQPDDGHLNAHRGSVSADGRVLVKREEAGAEGMGSGCKRNDSGCVDCLKKQTSSK